MTGTVFGKRNAGQVGHLQGPHNTHAVMHVAGCRRDRIGPLQQGVQRGVAMTVGVGRQLSTQGSICRRNRHEAVKQRLQVQPASRDDDCTLSAPPNIIDGLPRQVGAPGRIARLVWQEHIK